MSKRVELLAPAGDWNSFVAAVENGADAVYVGSTNFSARQNASNFDSQNLEMAVDYAHIRGVKVYLAMNILVKEDEMASALDMAKEAYDIGIDGLIVQDLGLATLVKKTMPKIPIHGSTQMTIHNKNGVEILENLDFQRVVLARELSLDEIKYICKSTSMDVEIFIHGALCISYSGQCLMSSLIGGRSGNRGRCAQPCRLPYSLMKDGKNVVSKKYLLSPKDICTLSMLGDIIEAGVKSLKIEGRMKTPEYVATAVRIYRKYIDAYYEKKSHVEPDEKDLKELMQSFNRGGFGGGYLKGKTGKSMMSYERPKNWGLHLGEVLSYDNFKKEASIRLKDNLSLGDGIEFVNGQGELPGTLVSEIKIDGKRVEKAQSGSMVLLGNIKGEIQIGNPVYKTSDKEMNLKAKETFANWSLRDAPLPSMQPGKFIKKIPLEVRFVMLKDTQPVMEVNDSHGNSSLVYGNILPEIALKVALSKERVIEQLNKTGSSPFIFSKIDIEMSEKLTLPVSEINRMRRSLLEDMEIKRAKACKRANLEGFDSIRSKYNDKPLAKHQKQDKLKVSLFFHQLKSETNFKGIKADRVYLPLENYLYSGDFKGIKELKEDGIEVFLWTPTIVRGNVEILLAERLIELVKNGVDGLKLGCISTFRAIEGVAKGNLSLMADYSWNIFNSNTVQVIKGFGMAGITLSPELTLKDMDGIKDIAEIEKEAIVYGNIPVMVSEYCPVGAFAGGFDEMNKCKGVCKNGSYTLKDRKDKELPILCSSKNCGSKLLNPDVLLVIDDLYKIKKAGIDTIRLDITREPISEVIDISEMFRDVWVNNEDLKKYGKLVNGIRDKGFTKGHYFRGV